MRSAVVLTDGTDTVRDVVDLTTAVDDIVVNCRQCTTPVRPSPT